jgi:hypothetical protein
MQRRHKWIWRRGSPLSKRVNGGTKNGNRDSEETESPQARLEREGARLLREWREMQEAISYSQELSSRQQTRMREAEAVSFGWGEGEHEALPTIRPFGADGVRERLRGRGEV